MNDKLHEDQIRVMAIAEAEKHITLTDHTGKKLIFFKNKKDGSMTSAFSSFIGLQVRVGSEIAIAYKVDSYQNKHTGGMSTSYQIMVIKDIDGKVKLPPVAQTQTRPVVEVNRGQSVESKPTDWERLGKVKSLHGFANAMIASGNTIGEVVACLRSGELMELYNEIDRAVDAKITIAEIKNVFPEEQEEEIRLEDVPFN